MPKEVIYRHGTASFADVMVRWSKSGQGFGGVDLFMISQREGVPNGSFWFEPEHPERQGLSENPIPDGERKPMVGPVSVDLDREGINRLIRTLRKARDQAYGSDA